MPASKPLPPPATLDDIHSALGDIAENLGRIAEALETICATFEDCTGRSNFGGREERGYVRIVDMGD
jgi:hypothetical protein